METNALSVTLLLGVELAPPEAEVELAEFIPSLKEMDDRIGPATPSPPAFGRGRSSFLMDGIELEALCTCVAAAAKAAAAD